MSMERRPQSAEVARDPASAVTAVPTGAGPVVNARERHRSVRWGAAAGILFATAAVLPAQAAAPNGFTRVECYRSDALVVHLRVAQQATPADREWLQFEFDNRTSNDLPIAGVSYQLSRAQVFDAVTGELLQTQSLGGGNNFDLGLWREGHPLQLPSGVTRVGATVSDYATALLGMPPARGWRVDAELTLLIGGAAAEGGAKAITCRWSPADGKGLERMRATLAELLAAERPPIGSLYLAGMLLDLPEVGGRCTVPDLLAVRARARGPFAPWTRVLRHLSSHRSTDPDVVAWIRARLQAGDPTVGEDLQQMPKVWHASFLDPLLRRYEAGREDRVPWLLEQRGFPHRGDAAAVRRLSAPLLAELGKPTAVRVALLARDEESMLRHQLSSVLGDLGRTCDAAVLPALVPWLRCTVVANRDLLSSSPSRSPTRLCDLAYLAIQRLRGKEPWQEVQSDGGPKGAVVGGRTRRRVAINEEGPALAHRDSCITALQRELADGK